MSPENEQRLTSAYPEIFRRGGARTGREIAFFGFECGDGWFTLINELCKTLTDTAKTKSLRIPEAVQVKEKFGALRFYVDEADSELYDLIEAAEKKSETTCETCGKPGKIVTTGWFVATCGEHK